MKTNSTHSSIFYLLFCFIIILFTTSSVHAGNLDKNNPNTDWMSGNWGIGFHYLQDKFNETMNGGSKEWNDAVNAFDVNKFADGVQRSGAKWTLFTMGQNSGYYCAPNATLDKYSGYKAGERNSTRDLIKDISKALKAKGIKLIIYLPSNAPANDSKIANGLGLTTLNGGNWVVNDTFLKRWSEVISEWSKRYGDDVAGWWFDGWYGGSGFKDAYGKYYADAVRGGNPKGVFCVNTGLNGNGLKLGSNYADYSALEARDLNHKCTSRWITSTNGTIGPLQWATFTLLGGGWWVEGSRDRYSESQVRGYMDTTLRNGGAITWATFVDVKGSVSERQIALLQKAAPQSPNKAPTVSISSPSNNATFTAPATIAINAVATDSDGSITKVEFFSGVTKLGEDASSPYSFAWNNVATGTYSITAKATDDKGAATTSSTVAVTVICSPTTITSYIQVDGGTWQKITNVSANSGSTVKFGPQPATGGSWKWSGPNGFSATSREVSISNIQSNQAGNYVVTYTNNVGCSSNATIMVTVNTVTTNTPPTVSITSPTNNATFTEGATITINADASDADGSVTKVEFFIGTTKIGEDATSPYSVSWSGATEGTCSLTAKATDNKGAITTCAAVSVTVNVPNNPCTGTPTYVENGGYIAGSKVQNAGGMYQCKPYPYAGWCNGAAWAYAPGTGTYWSDAWDKVGTCTPRMAVVNNESSNAVISILPNPTSQSAQVKLNVQDFSTAEYSVFNSLGMEVLIGKLDSNLEVVVDLSGMTNGIYTIRISANGNVWTDKIVKQ